MQKLIRQCKFFFPWWVNGRSTEEGCSKKLFNDKKSLWPTRNVGGPLAYLRKKISVYFWFDSAPKCCNLQSCPQLTSLFLAGIVFSLKACPWMFLRPVGPQPLPSTDTEIFAFRGFCYFNSIAIAARLLRLKSSVEKVLIVDWVSSLTCVCACNKFYFNVFNWCVYLVHYLMHYIFFRLFSHS